MGEGKTQNGGAAVWRGMRQDELDAQYDQRTLVPDLGPYAARWAAWGDDIRRSRPCETLAYGEAPSQTLDLFDGDGPGLPHLHFHGGAWRALSKRDAHFAVAGLAPVAAIVAIADFSLAPAVRLHDIVAEVRRAACTLIDRFGAISVSGHSSGAHLAGMLLDRDWWAEAGITAESIRWALLVSGPYDVEPVRLSARNAYLNLTPADAETLSANRRLPNRPPPTTLMWGAGELDEFRRQGADMAAALRAAGGAVTATECAGQNHFDMWDMFHDPASPVCRAAAALAETEQARPSKGAEP